MKILDVNTNLDWKVKILPIFTDNYVFLIQQNTTNHVIVVDPGEAEGVKNFLTKNSLKLTSIILTHHHQDHIGGVAALKDDYPAAKIYAPLKNKNEIPDADFYVQQGQSLVIENLTFEVLELPGHTLGHLAYWCKEQNWLFSGDVLFGLGCGRLFEGTFSQMFESLKAIKSLPQSTNIFCTHEYTETNLRFCDQIIQQQSEFLIPQDQLKSYAADLRQKRNQGLPSVPLSLATELKTNPFLRASTVEQFTEVRSRRNSFK